MYTNKQDVESKKDNSTSSKKAVLNKKEQTSQSPNSTVSKKIYTSSIQTSSTIENERDYVHSTPFFDIAIRNYWETNWYIESSHIQSDYENNTQGYVFTLSLYEGESYDRFGGGWLVSISLWNNTDYQDVGIYQKIGKLDNYDIVVYYPTDVQFDSETQTDYEKMRNVIPNIISSMKSQKYNLVLY